MSDESRQVWVAAKADEAPARLRMETPQGTFEAEAFELGTVTWDGASRTVRVESARPPREPRLQAEGVRLILPDR